MKVLIWFGCFFVMGAIQTVFKGIGISLGAILTVILYSLTFFAAKKLCNIYDDNRVVKKRNKIDKANFDKSGMSKEEYIKANVPVTYLEACERYRGRPMSLETYLLPLVKSGSISKVIYQLLLDEYSKK